MIEVVGWISTLLVLVGYITNSAGYSKIAMITWILGDLGWITYDIFISNISHLALSVIIICINVYGIFRIIKTERTKCINQ